MTKVTADCSECSGTGIESKADEMCTTCNGTGHKPMARSSRKPLYIS